jgi:meiotically up-regulated gene 157 (Mug157) protein
MSIVPGLLSLPYIGYCAKGIGSPHTPARYIWHIGLSMQALTTDSVKERNQLLNMLTHTDADTNLMHEAFLVDNPTHFILK